MPQCATCPNRSGCPTADLTEGRGTTNVMLVCDSLESFSRGRLHLGRFGKQYATQLNRLGLRLEDFYFGSAAACSPPASRLGYAAHQCDKLDTHITATGCRTFVALDPLSFERLTGLSKIPQLVARGYVYPERHGRGWVIPTLAAGGKQRGLTLEANPGMWLTWLADIRKALKVANENYSYATPRIFWRPSVAEWDRYVAEFLRDPSRPLAVDTEFPWKRAAEMSEEDKMAALDLTDRIDEMNFSYDEDHGGSVPWEAPYKEGALAMLHAAKTALFWNVRADAPRITASGGPKYTPDRYEDLMDTYRVWRNSSSRKLAVAATLWPSMHYAAPWKHLGTGDAYYRGMDAIALVRGQRDMHAALKEEGQWDAYTTFVRDLDPILYRMTQAGMRVDAPKVAGLSVDIARDMTGMQREMTALVPEGIRPEQTWKGRKAAEAGLLRLMAEGECAPDATLEEVAAEALVNQCSQCGATGIKKDHVSRKFLVDTAAPPAVEL
jgi:hypothetical protein